MHRKVPTAKRSRKNQRVYYLICATFIILGIFCSWDSPKLSLQMKPRSPRESQSFDVEINLLHHDSITIPQNDVARVNWSVIWAAGKYYRVLQGSQDGNATLDFGTINSGIYPLSTRVDSSQLGIFDITLEVYNDTYTISDTVQLTIEQTGGGITIPQIIFFVVLSIAVVANVSAGVFYRRKRQKDRLQGDLGKETKSGSFTSGGSVHSTYPDPEDQLYLLTTKVIELIVFLTKPLKILEVIQFKHQDYADINGPALLHQIYQINQDLQNVKNLRFPDRSLKSEAYLTCVQFPKQNNMLGIVTSDIGLDEFVTGIKNQLELLSGNKEELVLSPVKLTQNLIQNLHLDRSYEFEIPDGSKLRIIEQSILWQISPSGGQDLSQDQLREVETDLIDMSLGEVKAMVKFLDKNHQEILEEPKNNPEADPP